MSASSSSSSPSNSKAQQQQQQRHTTSNLPPPRLVIRSKDDATIYDVVKDVGNHGDKNNNGGGGGSSNNQVTLTPSRVYIPTSKKTGISSSSSSSSSSSPSPSPSLSCVKNAIMHACSPNGKLILFQTANIGIVARQLIDDDIDVDCGVDDDDNGDIEKKKKKQEEEERRNHDLDDDDAGRTPFLANSANVQYISFSSLGTYIVTWERPSPPRTTSTTNNNTNNSNNPKPNLKIWSSCNGKYCTGFYLKAIKRESWPNIRWTYDEQYAFHLVTNELRIYNGHDFIPTTEADDDGQSSSSSTAAAAAAAVPRFIAKVRCPNISSFTIAPKRIDGAAAAADSSYSSSSSKQQQQQQQQKKYLFSTFVPESKGKPAKISILRYPDRLGSVDNNKSLPMICGKIFYQAEEITVKWSPKGDSALVLTHTTVDKSGESYYGSTHLHLLKCGGGGAAGGGIGIGSSGDDDSSIAVPLPGDSKKGGGGGSGGGSGGPVMDVSWCPDSTKPSCFVVISGRMPSMASLHHGTTGEPLFLFGNAHRNTIVWSPSGRFLCLAGFGNLAGGMDFWDRNKQKKMPQYYYNFERRKKQILYGNTAKAAACQYGWSCDSRMFYIATTSPRMNVDNGVRLYKYNGLGPILEFTTNLSPNRLLNAEFIPCPEPNLLYPDRPQSPPPPEFKKMDVLSSAEGGGGGGGGSVGASGAVTATRGASSTMVTAQAAAAAAAPTTQAYVPPSARARMSAGRVGGGGGTSLAERMRAEREGSTLGAGKVGRKNTVVGMTQQQDKKSKSALRREKQRLKKKQQQAEEEEEEAMRIEQERLKKEADAEAAAAANVEPVDPVKRMKKIKKVLKQIDELKLKKKDAASTLNEDQMKKLSTESSLREELAQLEKE